MYLSRNFIRKNMLQVALLLVVMVMNLLLVGCEEKSSQQDAPAQNNATPKQTDPEAPAPPPNFSPAPDTKKSTPPLKQTDPEAPAPPPDFSPAPDTKKSTPPPKKADPEAPAPPPAAAPPKTDTTAPLVDL